MMKQAKRLLKSILTAALALILMLQPLAANAVITEQPAVKPAETTAEAGQRIDIQTVSGAGEQPFSMTAETPQEGTAPGAAVTATAYTDTDSVVVHAIVNTLNQMMSPDKIPDENGTWEEPTLKDYPLDPHKLEEYGDSPRVRFYGDEEETPAESDPEEEKKPSYLVYRESIYLVPAEEAKQYTVTYSEDRSTAVLTPAIPLETLEGKTGIALLGEAIEEDEVLIFARTPAEDGGDLKISLAKTEDLRINHLFSDGHFNIRQVDGEEEDPEKRDTTVTAGAEAAGQIAYNGDGKLPARQKAGVFDWVDPLLWLDQEVEGDGWNGKITDIEPTSPGFWYDLDFWEGSFDWYVYFGVESDFEFWATQQVNRTTTKELVSVPIYITRQIWIHLSYFYTVEFGGPMHVKGHAATNVRLGGFLAGLAGQSSSWQAWTDVDLENVDLGATESLANQEDPIPFYIGANLVSNFSILHLVIVVPYIKKYKLGPIISVDFDFGSGAEGKVWWKKGTEPMPDDDVLENEDPIDPPPGVIHSCLWPGAGNGCVEVKTNTTRSYRINIRLNIIIKEWKFKIISGSSPEQGSERLYYQSLSFGETKLTEGSCPHELYRVPITVCSSYTEDPEWGYPLYDAVEGITVTTTNPTYTTEEIEEPFSTGVSNWAGETAVYLPYAADYRYRFMATGESNGATLYGTGVQPEDMRAAGNNERVYILVGTTNQRTFNIRKEWETDYYKQDKPQQIQVVLQRWDNTARKWQPVILEDTHLPAVATLTDDQSGCSFTAPGFEMNGGRVSEIRYRVRELDCAEPIDVSGYAGLDDSGKQALMDRINSHVVHAPDDADARSGETAGYVIYPVEAYIDLTGTLNPDHETKYKVSYADTENGTGTAVTITNTAVYDVGLHKQWIGVPEEERPEYVYLTLMGETERGWEDVALNHAQSYYGVMKPLPDPLDGDALSLTQIAEAGDLVLSEPIGARFTIVKVSPETDWSGYLTIRKYYDGVKLRYEAAELDDTIVRRLLEFEYGLHLETNMRTEGDWTSFPCAAHSVSADYTLTGTVINSKDDPKHTISGMKYWIPGEGESESYPDKVTLQVWRVETDDYGNETARTAVGEPFDVLKPDSPAGETEKKMWAWTFTDPEIDPEESYTVTESMPDGYADRDHYLSVTEGTDVTNIWHEEPPKVTVNIYFEYEEDKTRPLSVHLRYKDADGTGRNISVDSLEEISNGYSRTFGLDMLEGIDPSTFDFNECSISERITGGAGWNLVPRYAKPELVVRDGVPYYVFAVLNLRQQDVEVIVVKQWDFPEGKQVSEKMPENIEVTLWRDNNETIDEVGKLSEPSGKTMGDGAHDYSISKTFTKDANGADLTLLDEHGNLNEYIIEETRFDHLIWPYDTESATEGFLPVYSAVEQDIIGPDGGHKRIIRLTVTNRWIDQDTEDYVTVAGKKTWAGDEGKERLRPDEIVLSVLNQRGEHVKSIRATADAQGEITWSIPGLPRYDTDGTTEMQYRVIESMVDGYTASYDDPVYNDAIHTWTCNVTNTLTGYFPLKVSKVIDGPKPDNPETFTFTLKKREDVPGADEEHWTFPMPQGTEEDADSYTWTIEGEGEQTLEFLFSEQGVYLYEITETAGTNEGWIYDTEPRLVMITVFRNEEGGMDITSYVDKDRTGENGEADDDLEELLPTIQTDEVTFTNASSKHTLTVKKEWDIDIEKKDHPESIEVLIQRKTGEGDSGKWETVEKAELEGDDDWQKEVTVPEKDDSGKEYEYRVRELAPKNGLRDKLQDLANEYFGKAKEKFDEWFGKLKDMGKDWIDGLPEEIRNAAEQGYDQLAEKLDATEDDIFSKLQEKIQFTKDEDRIVFDGDDEDKPKKKDGDDEEPETNAVAYKVPSYVSVLSGNVDEHETKYKVSYKKDDDTYTITNLAITEIDLTKRWFIPGGDDEDKPDSAWVVLLFNVDPEVLDKAGNLPGAGELISKLKNIQLPLFKLTSLLDDFNNLLEGGINPVNLISELALGLDLDVFGLAEGIKVSVARVDEDSDWTAHFTAKKYTLGFPVEYTGAELSSEIIRQLIKYIFHINLKISWTPFGNYVSIPGKAYGNLVDASVIQNLFDLDDDSISGKITGALLEFVTDKLNELLGEILPEGLPVGLDDWELAANVINVKIELPDIPDTVEIEKHWVGSDEMVIPDSITLEVELTMKDGTTQTETIELKKADYEDEYEWTLDLNEYIKAQNPDDDGNGEGDDDDDDDDEDPVEDGRILSETLPDDFEYKDKYDTDIDSLEITNTWITPGKVTVFGQKVWDDDDDRDGIRPEKVTVNLLANGQPVMKTGQQAATPTDLPEDTDPEPEPIQAVTSEAGEWKFSFPNLPEKDENEQAITYTVEEEPVEGYDTEISDPENGTATVKYTITNRHVPEPAPDVKVEKKWDDGNDADGFRPEEVTVKLLYTATPTDLDSCEEADSAELNEDNGWEHTFTGLKKNDHGMELTYTVEEEPVAEYEPTVSGPAEDGDAVLYTVTNKHTYAVTDVSGKKVWDDEDDRDGIRPDSVTVILYGNGTRYAEKAVTAADGWEFTFRNVPVNENGEPITWTVDEEPPDGYEKSVNGTTITNRHVPEPAPDVKVEKKWDDGNDADGFRPEEVTVKLLYTATPTDLDSSEEADSAELNEDNGWEHTFTGLKKNDHGMELTYTVEEEPVAEYEPTVSGPAEDGDAVLYTVTNKHTPAVIDVSGKKVWDDDDDRDGIRPDSVTVILYGNGNKYAEKAVTAADGWEFTFRNVPENAGGRPVIYTVDEVPVTGYEKSVNGTTITNRHIPGTVSISGTKTWDDADDQDGLRPDSVTVKLLKNGTEIDSRKTTADLGWKYSFANLDEKENGADIAYTVDEEPVAGYEKTVTGYDIANKHTPAVIDVSGKKVWDDDDDRDGIRPDSVTVILYGNGNKYAEKAVTAADGWEFTFRNVPENAGGRPVIYTVDEVPVTGYEKSVNGTTITNRHIPGTVSISGTKTWDDADDQDGIRPDSVTVKLLKNGTEIDSRKTTADLGWKYSFANLDEKENGADIAYTVDEEPVAGYEKTVTGYDITNKHTPAVIDVSGKKVWDDEDDRDGIRPDSVTVILYGNGNKYAEKAVTAADGWEFTFRNVPENAGGRPVIYTADEVPVTGYQKSVDGTTITNKHIPGTVSISGTKTWDDEDDKDGIRPDSVTVKLLKYGAEIDSRETTADYEWKYSFANLPKAENGMVIRYSVKEEPVPEGYTAEVDGYDIINSHDPAEMKKYTITYDPNGGTLDGSTEPVSTEHEENEIITIREAPVRTGYSFLYWKGSRYDPGDKYTVTEDHTFTAQWNKDVDPGPYQYRFTFTKKWSGGHNDSIDWTLYDPDGNVVHKKFKKKIISETEWHYEAWFTLEKDYYIIETAPAGYKVRYENTGAHADVTDRCYNGGTIINYRIPKTGDTTAPSILWIGCALLGLLGIGGTLFVRRRGKGRRRL